MLFCFFFRNCNLLHKEHFTATNIIIGIDKKCFLESRLRPKQKNKFNGKMSFHRKRNNLLKSEKNSKHSHFRKNKSKNDILSVNYTPNIKTTITTTFYLDINGRNIKANLLIDSGSARVLFVKTSQILINYLC